MATFTCKKHLAEVAKACGFKVTEEGRPGFPFRVELQATGKAAKRLKRELFSVAFIGLGGCPCCTRLKFREPAAAAAIFQL